MRTSGFQASSSTILSTIILAPERGYRGFPFLLYSMDEEHYIISLRRKMSAIQILRNRLITVDLAGGVHLDIRVRAHIQ